VVHEYRSLLGAQARLIAADAEGLSLIVLDAPALYDRPGGPYLGPDGIDHPDNWRRFGALCRAAADIAAGRLPDFVPDLVHAHDWQAGLTPAYLRYHGIGKPSVMTIHNIAFQGWFPPGAFGPLELPPQAFALDGVEYHGGVGYLKAGLACASAITTVSPTYAEEITTADYGMGLQGLISARKNVLHGIVNGIDTEVWNPETDPHLPATFSAKKLRDRQKNREALERRFGLHSDASPLLVLVSRLTWQKGIDLLAWITFQDIVRAGLRLTVLGSGEGGLETTFLSLAAEFPGRVGVVIGYDEPLAHLMQGGGDAIVIPSRFEPCGLTQLYGLRYGCVPIVARTGGLADTVIDANIAALNAGVATGFQFTPVDAAPFAGAVRRAAALMREPATWAAIQKQGMKADVSWDRSAALYADLYSSLVPDQAK
jgi:starch synthase